MSEQDEAAGAVERPKTFGEAMRAFEVKTTDEDESLAVVAEMEEREREARKKRSEEVAKTLAGADPQPMTAAGFPEWLIVPPDLKFPKGKTVHFLRIPAKWTDTPEKGDRQCIMWNLTDADEKLAGKRTRGEQTRGIAECTKQMIRAIDGEKVDWTRGHLANIEHWWGEVGSRVRNHLASVWYKSHHLNAEEQADFFANCYVVRTVQTG